MRHAPLFLEKEHAQVWRALLDPSWLSEWDLSPPSGMGGCKIRALWHCESFY